MNNEGLTLTTNLLRDGAEGAINLLSNVLSKIDKLSRASKVCPLVS